MKKIICIVVLVLVLSGCRQPSAGTSNLNVSSSVIDEASISKENYSWVESEGLSRFSGEDAFYVKTSDGKGAYYYLHRKSGTGQQYFNEGQVLVVKINEEKERYFKYANNKLWEYVESIE